MLIEIHSLEILTSGILEDPKFLTFAHLKHSSFPAEHVSQGYILFSESTYLYLK